MERTPNRTVYRLLAVVAVAAALLLTTGTAAAAPGRSHLPDVVPLVDCVMAHPDGSWTAVFGYDNRTGATVDIPFGPGNQVTPAGYDGDQPAQFAAGVHHGVFAVVVSRGGGPMWHLGGENLAARFDGAVCPAATELPADGNGLGMSIALCGAGVLAIVLVYRWRRRGQPT
ncbi:hypothetical protein [Blastococcus sp. URHD0036]|uniref:hypothetical protein n=1 Tax=Blastococcus sp. URHD0036 TaxID=1380356 RepID=UPI000495FA9E|nr:hypothetical protein [Blastococcus sp. URHD0036]